MPVSTNSAAVLDYLAKLNAHPRDARIQFEESTHIYTVDGDSNYKSVTTWNHHHFPKFDADKIIKQIISSKKHKTDPEYKYYQMTAGQIMDMWNANRDGASSAGTNMHYDIECFYNQIDVSNDSIEYRYFQNFLRENPHLHAYRTEWTIYHEELKIAGSVDMVYENPNGTLLIYDWKRCKEIVKENLYGSTATTECIRHLPDTNFWHYALQLNTYKTIIEEKYGKKVVGLCLVCLHPNNADYQLIEVPFMEKELVDLFEYRKEMLIKQKAKTNDKPLAKTKSVEKASVDKSISNYFKPVEKKGSGLLINLNSI
jgi:ATP-dependent exoDNAse (exonuclease V) beta subunit